MSGPQNMPDKYDEHPTMADIVENMRKIFGESGI